MRHFTNKERAAILKGVKARIERGETSKDACASANIHPTVYRKWLKWEAEGKLARHPDRYYNKRRRLRRSKSAGRKAKGTRYSIDGATELTMIEKAGRMEIFITTNRTVANRVLAAVANGDA